MPVASVKAEDGSNVEFVENNDPKQGAIKDVFFSPDKSYVVAFFRKPLTFDGEERIKKIVGDYRSRIFEQTGGEYWRKIYRWPEKIVKYNGRMGIVVPAYEKNFFFTGGNLDGAEKEGKWFASAKNFNRFVPPEERGDLGKFIHICLLLSRGVRRLHAAGLAHSDLSYKNCLVDPKSGDACIIDVDGLVVPGLFPPDVLGTPDFIAPEVMKTLKSPNKILPSRDTDRHALAVLIYLYLFHRHPLRGGKVWSMDQDEQERLEMGDNALFIENKQDARNRLKVGRDDAVLMPWCDVDKLPYDKISGPYLSKLFESAFIDGLHDPNQRPSANDWEDALISTSDLLLRCENPKCPKKFFVYDNSTKPSCPYCGERYKYSLPVLDFYYFTNKSYRRENRRLIVWNGQSLYQWHCDRGVAPNERVTDEQKKRVGYFSFHQGKWWLVNERGQGMRNLGTKAEIRPGSGVVLENNMQLALGAGPSARVVNIQITNL